MFLPSTTAVATPNRNCDRANADPLLLVFSSHRPSVRAAASRLLRVRFCSRRIASVQLIANHRTETVLLPLFVAMRPTEVCTILVLFAAAALICPSAAMPSKRMAAETAAVYEEVLRYALIPRLCLPAFRIRNIRRFLHTPLTSASYVSACPT